MMKMLLVLLKIWQNQKACLLVSLPVQIYGLVHKLHQEQKIKAKQLLPCYVIQAKDI